MFVQDQEFTLKDGRKAILRSAQEKDVPGVLEYLYISACETEFIIRYPEECSKYTAEGEKALFDRCNANENETMLVCVVDDRIIGCANIFWSRAIKTRHRASVAIAILKEFWGLGVGSRLFDELIDIARANPELLQVELEFIEGNSRARALYEKKGFRITGVKPDVFRLKDGTLLNEYTMMLKLK